MRRHLGAVAGAVGMAGLPKPLVDGYGRFRGARLEAERERYRRLAETGQKPATMVVGCCDSRVAPEVIFDAGPGELFVVRNVANLVPPFAPDDDFHGTAAALEFAVEVLGVANILILGHCRCGGIGAALDPEGVPLPPGHYIGRWMSLVERAVEALGREDVAEEERQTALERLSVAFSLDNLRTYPFIAEREKAGSLALHGAWFDIGSGELWRLEQGECDWAPLAGDEAASP